MRRVPVYTPGWTDHADSDPGVTLLQLFAFLAENLLYRSNQRPDREYFDGRRLEPRDLASERCYLLRRKRRLLWTICGVSFVALLLVLAARRRAKERSTEPEAEA